MCPQTKGTASFGSGKGFHGERGREREESILSYLLQAPASLCCQPYKLCWHRALEKGSTGKGDFSSDTPGKLLYFSHLCFCFPERGG